MPTQVKAIISEWTFDGTYVWGQDLLHEPTDIRTSIVKRIWLDNDNRVICETQNSLYELSVPHT